MSEEIKRLDEDVVRKTTVETVQISELESQLVDWESEVTNLENRSDLVRARETVVSLKKQIADLKEIAVGETVITPDESQ